MAEENIDLLDPEETVTDIDAGAIDEDWNCAPDDKLGAEDHDGDDQDDENTAETGEDSSTGVNVKRELSAGDQTDSGGADQSFTLKHLSDVKTVGRDEVIALAQKGLDYDRIRGKFDMAAAGLSKTEDAYAVFRELAEAQGTTAEQLIDATRAQMLAQKHGIDMAEAVRRVAAVRAEKEKTSPRLDPAAVRRQTEIREFLNEYGTGIDPKSIPQEVWQSVAKGKTLLGAYQAWELQKLRTESKAAKKNSENKIKSAGSRFSLGNPGPRDAIADDWFGN